MLYGTRRAMARARRYSQITRIAVRHGLGPHLRGRRTRGAATSGAATSDAATSGRAALAASLRRALEEGGVTFTKLGQLLSTRSDLLPAEFIAELSRLQDRAEPAPWEQVRQLIATSIGMPVEQAFAVLEPEPAAAASIAQVHRARLRRGDGRDDGRDDGPGAEVAAHAADAGGRHSLRGPRVRRRPAGRAGIAAGRAEVGGGRADVGAAGAAQAAAPVRPHHQRGGTGQAEPERAAVLRRAGPPGRHHLASQFLLAILGAAAGITGALLLGVSSGPKVAQEVSLCQLIGYNLLIVTAVLVLRVLFTIFRRH
jgi:ubiquinone biosynthesis protein